MRYPTFEDFAEVVGDSVRSKRVKSLDPDTQFVRDLGITEKQGIDLLKRIEVHYGIEFTTQPFDRMQGEFLSHSKDADEFPVIQPLLGTSRSEVRPFTVGLLYKAVLQELSRGPDVSRKNSTKLHLLKGTGRLD